MSVSQMRVSFQQNRLCKMCASVPDGPSLKTCKCFNRGCMRCGLCEGHMASNCPFQAVFTDLPKSYYVHSSCLLPMKIGTVSFHDGSLSRDRCKAVDDVMRYYLCKLFRVQYPMSPDNGVDKMREFATAQFRNVNVRGMCDLYNNYATSFQEN